MGVLRHLNMRASMALSDFLLKASRGFLRPKFSLLMPLRLLKPLEIRLQMVEY